MVVCFLIDDLASGVVTAMNDAMASEADVFFVVEFRKAFIVGQVI